MQLPLAGIVPPVRVKLLAACVAVPPQVVAAVPATGVNPLGNGSVILAPVSAVLLGLLSVTVSVLVPPAGIGFGEKDLVTLGADTTCVVTLEGLPTGSLAGLESLLFGVMSSVLELPETRLTSVPVLGAVPVTVKLTGAPTASVGSVHVTVLEVTTPLLEAVTPVKALGSVSVTTTLLALDGPLLTTVTV